MGQITIFNEEKDFNKENDFNNDNMKRGTIKRKTRKTSSNKVKETTVKNNDFLEKKFAAGKKIWLSPSGIEGLSRCPRCFWLQYNRGIRQPEGIVSRLANRFDGVIKRYFDLYRKVGDLPPMVAGKVEGKLQNPFRDAYFYHYNKKYGFMGRLDECLVLPDGRHTPVDHKTASSDPREREIMEAYQNQLDSYAFLLEANNKKTSGQGHLIYFYPEDHSELHNGFQMLIYIKTLKTNPNLAYKRFLGAMKVLEKPLPQPSKDCSFCQWYEQIGKEI
jgi:hypothetical protein